MFCVERPRRQDKFSRSGTKKPSFRGRRAGNGRFCVSDGAVRRLALYLFQRRNALAFAKTLLAMRIFVLSYL